MAITKREHPLTTKEEEEEYHAKRLKNNVTSNGSDQSPCLRVVLNPADCDLAFNIEADGITGHALYEKGFAYCWSGSRANIGITGGKYCFGCRIISDQPVEMKDTPLIQQHVCRVGISTSDDPVGNLGETKSSFGYGGTGKFSTDSKFVDYGEKFGIGDTILCLVDLESKPLASLEFSKNGKRLGIAKHFDAGTKVNLFPHVLLKNTGVMMQFCIEDGLVPEEGYRPWASAVTDGKAIIGPAFSDPQDCEVVMMVGLPASGKTTWAEKWVKEHPEKRYILLGTNLALDQMKVPGLLRKFNYGQRFDRLMDQATGIFNTLLSRASKVSRNYIIDQTNVYKSARKRKLKPFAFFHKIAVVVFPRQEELKVRGEKRFREMGKEVPSEAVNDMLANFVLPMSKDMLGTDEYFDQVIFTDLGRDEAQQHLVEMKHALLLSSNMNPKSDHSPYPRESSVYSDTRLSSGPGYLRSGYSTPSAGLQTDFGPGMSWIGRPEPGLQTSPANVNRGYSEVSMQPFSFNVNTRYENPGFSGRSEPSAGSYGPYQGSLNVMPSWDSYPVTHSSYSNHGLREDGGYPRTHSSYSNPGLGDTGGGYARTYYSDPGPSNGFSQNGRDICDPPYVLPYGILYSGPGESYPADVHHTGTAPYRPPIYY